MFTHLCFGSAMFFCDFENLASAIWLYLVPCALVIHINYPLLLVLSTITKLDLLRDVQGQKVEDKSYSMSRRTILKCCTTLGWTFRGNA